MFSHHSVSLAKDIAILGTIMTVLFGFIIRGKLMYYPICLNVL